MNTRRKNSTQQTPMASRRGFLRAGGLVAISTFVPSLGCDSNAVSILNTPTGPDMDQMPASPIISNGDFYLQSINGQNYDPRLKAQNWSLRIDGLVERPQMALTYAAVTGMPLQRQVLTMQCTGNWIGGPLVGNAEWGGTRFAHLLEDVGVRGAAIRVKFTSVDGYTTSIPLDRAQRDNVLLVWEMNGEQLPSKHGYPVRLINPGHYGQKMPKWITRIELIDEVYLGYWESKPDGRDFNWSDEASATVNSRIDAPLSVWDDVKDPGNGGVMDSFQPLQGAIGEPYMIHGLAMAGERHVDLVEVSTDGGSTWSAAQILTRSEPNVWVSWAYNWQLPVSGRYEILARATDAAGISQPGIDAGVDLYDGRTGWHSVRVDVSSS